MSNNFCNKRFYIYLLTSDLDVLTPDIRKRVVLLV